MEEEKNKVKIFDIFPFFNEESVLLIRLETLYDHVDHFILVESNQTYTLKHSPKELTYLENKEKFAKYADKIIHVPLINKFEAGNPWRNEYLQRDSGVIPFLNGDITIRDNDVIMLSDVDEIPDPSFFYEMRELVSQDKVVAFKHKMYRYFLNVMCTHELWKGTRCVNFKRFKENIGRLETLRHIKEEFIEGGWHFTGVGSPENFAKKCQSFSHADICDTPEYTDPENIKKLFKEKVIDKGVDIHHFNNARYKIDEDRDSFLPKCIDEKDFEHLIYKGGDWV
jgi:hypothetical protein